MYILLLNCVKCNVCKMYVYVVNCDHLCINQPFTTFYQISIFNVVLLALFMLIITGVFIPVTFQNLWAANVTVLKYFISRRVRSSVRCNCSVPRSENHGVVLTVHCVSIPIQSVPILFHHHAVVLMFHCVSIPIQSVPILFHHHAVVLMVHCVSIPIQSVPHSVPPSCSRIDGPLCLYSNSIRPHSVPPSCSRINVPLCLYSNSIRPHSVPPSCSRINGPLCLYSNSIRSPFCSTIMQSY